MPARASAFAAASTGAKPNRCGSSAWAPRPAIRASGSSPRPASREPMSSPLAPSLRGEALPGVIVPSGRNAGVRRGQLLGRAAGSDALVPVQVHARDRHHEVVVEAVVPRGGGQVVGPGGELVLARAADPELVRKLLVGLPEGDRPLRRHPVVDQPPAQGRRDGGDVAGREGTGGLGQHPGRPGHRLDSPGDDHVRVAGLDRARGDHRGVEAGAAEPVDGRRRHRDRQSGQQHRHPPHVAVVLARAVGVAPDDVADPGRVEGRGLGEHAAQRGGGEVVGTDLGQRPAEAPERGPRGGVQEGIGHVGSPGRSSLRTCCAIRNAVLASGTPQ